MRRLAASLVLVAALAAAASGDRETALFSSGRGDKALAAKKWDEAQELYRKALEEDETYLPARFGLSQALLGCGSSAAAIDELRKFADDARALAAALPAEWKPTAAKADKQLLELDALGSSFTKIQNTYVDGLVDLAQRCADKDPATADKALRRALALRPDHAKALKLAEKTGTTAAAASETVQLFDGTSFEGWKTDGAPKWTVNEGAIVGFLEQGANVMRSEREFEGDFTVRCEMRITNQYAQPVWVALMAAAKDKENAYHFGFQRGRVDFLDLTEAQKARGVAAKTPAELKKPYDPAAWNTYELRFAGDVVVALLNGEEIGREERPAWRQGGKIGFRIQNARMCVRKVEVAVK